MCISGHNEKVAVITMFLGNVTWQILILKIVTTTQAQCDKRPTCAMLDVTPGGMVISINEWSKSCVRP